MTLSSYLSSGRTMSDCRTVTEKKSGGTVEQTASPTFVVPITAIFAKQPWMPRRIVRQIFSMFLPGFDGRLSHQMYPNVATSMSEKDQNYPLPEDHPGIKYHKLMVSEVLTYPHVFILIYDAHVCRQQNPQTPNAVLGARRL